MNRIDTQKELLGNDRHIQRFIEIGPAKVLASEYESENVAQEPPKTATPISQPAPAKAPEAVSAPISAAVPAQLAPAAIVADVDLTPTNIILAVVAQKLRKRFDEIPGETSIRALSAGKFNTHED